MENIEVEIKKLGDLVENVTKQAEAKSKEATEALDKKMAELKEAVESKASADTIETLKKEMQAQYDEFVTKGAGSVKKAEVKTLNTALGEALSEYKFAPEGMDGEFTNRLRKEKSIKIELPEVKLMLEDSEMKAMSLANNLTGDPVASYGPRQAILPSQLINFRDLVPTLNTETGLYVFYKETPTTNNIGVQGEGCTKGENTYALSEVKVVQNYEAGFVNFTKQMATSLPWLTQTLPRMLMRDYYKKENASFYSTVSSAATAVTSSETDNVKKIIDFVTSQNDLNYAVSAIIVSNADMGKLIKSTYTNGYYSGAGGVVMNGQGNGLMIMGIPVIAASWATTGHALLWDNNFIERVQVRGLAIEFSYENNDNFVKNQVTARVECQTEINLMLGAAAAYGTLA